MNEDFRKMKTTSNLKNFIKKMSFEYLFTEEIVMHYPLPPTPIYVCSCSTLPAIPCAGLRYSPELCKLYLQF